MAIYLFIFTSLTAFGIFCNFRSGQGKVDSFFRRKDFYLCVCFFILMFAGLRNEIGGDWFAYKSTFDGLNYFTDLGFNIFLKPLFYFIFVLIKKIGGDIHWVIFTLSVLSLGPYFWICSRLPNPFFALSGSFFWVVVILQIGFTAQGLAFGLLIPFFFHLNKGRIILASFFMASACLIHFSALLFAPILVVKMLRNFWFFVFIVAFLVLCVLAFYISGSFGYFYNLVVAYLQMGAGGGLMIRSILSMLTAVLFLRLALRYRTLIGEPAYKLSLSLIVIFVFVIGFGVVIGGSLFDRFQLYFLAGWFLLGGCIDRRLYANSLSYQIDVIGFIFLSFLTLVTWLQFADHAYLWVPYTSIPLV